MYTNKKRKEMKSDVGNRQPRITSFFPTLRTSEDVENAVVKLNNNNNDEKPITAGLNLNTPNVTTASRNPFNKSSALSTGPRWSGKTENRCPMYKRIPDTPFVVDAFSHGSIPGIACYFLTHFHSDHYHGLTTKFTQALYCNKVTANLVKIRLRVKDEFINVLPMDKPCFVHGMEITLIDANHCPGSAMFLFRYPDGRTLLHTGDFRANTEMEKHPVLLCKQINVLYLDTTYCNPTYHFPDQQAVLENIVKMASKYYNDEPRTLFVCGSYTIGKEKVFLEISKALQLNVWANREKTRVLKCQENMYLSSILTPDENKAQIHVLPLGQVNFEFLQEYLQRFKHRFNQIVGLKPSGWEFSGKRSALDFKFRKQGSVYIYGIPYSEHSSYNELQRFVQFVQPDRIVPTVNVSGKAGQKTQDILLQWTNKVPNPQQSLDLWARKRKLS